MTEPDPEGGGASQSTQPAQGTSSATDISLREHFEALARKDERFEAERDRRYAEVALEREKALKIKETADLAALQLAREIQTYKDEKANELREQINSERGLYVTKGELISAIEKVEAMIQPLADFITGQRSVTQTRTRAQDRVAPWTVAMGSALMAALVTLLGLAASGHLG